MSKNIYFYVFAFLIVTSCKKSDDNNGSATPTATGPQITANAFINSHLSGSKLEGYRLDSGIISVPTSTSGFTFNYLSVPNGTAWKDTLKAVTNTTDFPNATYTNGINQTMLGTNLSIFRYFKVSNTAWTIMGDDYGAATISIPTLGTASLAKQAVKLTPNQTLASFPINYRDSFAQTCSGQLTFNANITSPIALNGPITVNQSTSVKSNNIAWGTMKIKGYADSLSTVIQKYSTDITTNFSSTNPLINAVLPQLLSNFGMTNNQTISTTSYRYWVVGKGLVMTLNADGTATVTTGL